MTAPSPAGQTPADRREAMRAAVEKATRAAEECRRIAAAAVEVLRGEGR